MAGDSTRKLDDSLQRFIETEDFSVLEKPIQFERADGFKSLLCFQGVVAGLASVGISALLCPLGTFAGPCTLFHQHSLRLDKDAVQMSSAANDCFCHIANTKKTVPLEKIQDVELKESCLLTLCGLQQVNIQTAGQGGPGAEISATFLKSPEQAREAIQLAVKLHKQYASNLAAPAPHSGMQRSAAGPAASPGSAWPGATQASSPAVAAAAGQLMQRLQAMDQLVAKGVLSGEEANDLKVAVLAAQQDPTQRLVEAADLLDQQLLTKDEFEGLKSSLVRQIQLQKE